MPSEKTPREPRQKQPAAQPGPASARAKQRQQAVAPRHRGHGPLGMDSEQSARLLLFGVTAAVLIAVAAFLVIGYYVSVIQPRGRTVLQVDDTEVSYSAMKRRVAHEYYTTPAYQTLQSVRLVPGIAYSNLVDELVLINRAETALGLTIDAAALDAEERLEIGVGADADEATYSERYRSALSASRLHDDEFKRKIRAAVIADKAREKLNTETPAVVPQAKVELILTSELETAQQAVDRVRAGEDWKTVATELSLESDAATTGGLKDYEFEKALPAAYQSFAFSAPIGDISEPLQDPSGQGAYYVVRLVDRSDQALTEEQKPAYQSARYTDWLGEIRSQAVIVDKWTTDDEAQASAQEPILKDATERFIRQQQLALTPQPTIDPNAIATSQAERTVAAQTAAAGASPSPSPDATSDSATPVATSSSDGVTPVPPNGQ